MYKEEIMSYIKGNFKKYIFRSDSGYTVGLFHVKEANIELRTNTVTFTGYFSDLNEIDLYKFEGEFITHNKYGKQFNVTSYEVILPDDDENIISFLSSELFKGIGQKKATSIVDTLGKNCLNIILEDKDGRSVIRKSLIALVKNFSERMMLKRVL